MGALDALDVRVLDLDYGRAGVHPGVLRVHDRPDAGAHAAGPIGEEIDESDEREARDGVGVEGRGV